MRIAGVEVETIEFVSVPNRTHDFPDHPMVEAGLRKLACLQCAGPLESRMLRGDVRPVYAVRCSNCADVMCAAATIEDLQEMIDAHINHQ